MLAFFNLIRFKNLLIILLVQGLIKYSLLNSSIAATTLDTFHFILLMLATVFIAAGGYVINDIYDVNIDKINKPEKVIIHKKISESTANNLYLAFTFVGVVIGFYLSNHIGSPGFAALFIIVAALLYMYASYLKSILLIGNIVVSLIVAFSLIIVGIFDLIPAIDYLNQARQLEVFTIISFYALFAFLLTFLREIVKDIEDINGDKNGGRQTLPIVLGRKRTTIVCFVFAIAIAALILVYMYSNLYRATWVMLYFLITIIGPLLYFIVKIITAEKKTDFKHLSAILKTVMILGLLTLFFYRFNLL